MAKETKILQVKRGTTTDWASEVAPLRAGELGYDTTTKEIKCGDGTTAFPSLPALGAGGGGTGDVVSFNDVSMFQVGTGGTYTTINEALRDLSKFHVCSPDSLAPDPTASLPGPRVVLALMPGYVITEPIIADGINLSWITIVSLAQVQSETEALVTVNADAIRDSGWQGQRGVFVAMNGGVCPLVGFGFQMIGEDQIQSYESVNALFAVSGGKIFTFPYLIYYQNNFQIKNCEGYALKAEDGGYISADSIFINACQGYNAVYASTFGKINMGFGIVTDCAVNGLNADFGGVIYAEEAEVETNATDSFYYAVCAYSGGQVIIPYGSALCGTGEPTQNDLYVSRGGLIFAKEATGGTSQTPNTITADGIIFK